MRKILFVEDNALIARIYSQKLLEQGFEVIVAGDGLEAMKCLPGLLPDLVVLDLLMPKMTGADVLKFMRGRADLEAIPVIVFSNSFLSSLVEQISKLKVEATLVKATVTPMQLVETIKRTLDDSARAPVPSAPAAAPRAVKREPPAAAPAPPADAVKAAPVRTPPPAAAPLPEPGVSHESDSEFAARIGGQFLNRAPVVFKELRQICREFLEAAKTGREPDCLLALSRKLAFLTQITGMAGYARTAELSSVLEALVFELVNKPAAITDSSRQTIAATIAFLADRFDRKEYADEQSRPPGSILVVDDDAVSNLAVVQSLTRAKLSAVSVADPVKALEMLGQAAYDAVLMDVSMPVMDGLALCERMRELPAHRRTPVIFVTGMADFNTHARSVLSGGDDLIVKPISPNELCVKVITHLLRAR